MAPFPTSGISLQAPPEQYRSALLSWFEGHRRSLPWRKQRTLYGTWISEMMLQQTTVSTVIPYWENFLAAYPDVHSLAAAAEADVLALWSGLGYYRRARHLHAAAKMVVDRFAGKLPADREGWLELPGVGPYASGAIASIGLGQRVPALDANARRVLARWLLADPVGWETLPAGHLEAVAGDLVDPSHPGDWNEALMELGALVCHATGPSCGGCPVRTHCRAAGAGVADLIPPRKIVKKAVPVRLGVLALFWHDQVLLMPPSSGPAAVPDNGGNPVRADVTGLHQGLWGLPSTPWLSAPSGEDSPWPPGFWQPWLQATFSIGPREVGPFPEWVGHFSHAVTHYRLKVLVYGLRWPESPEPAGDFWGRDLERQADKAGSDGEAGPLFCPWPTRRRPVSSLVRKSLQLAVEHRV